MIEGAVGEFIKNGRLLELRLVFYSFSTLSPIFSSYTQRLLLIDLKRDDIMAKIFTTSDVASHNKPGDLYIVVDGDVYDVTKFQDDHPGMFDRILRLSTPIET